MALAALLQVVPNEVSAKWIKYIIRIVIGGSPATAIDRGRGETLRIDVDEISMVISIEPCRIPICDEVYAHGSSLVRTRGESNLCRLIENSSDVRHIDDYAGASPGPLINSNRKRKRLTRIQELKRNRARVGAKVTTPKCQLVLGLDISVSLEIGRAHV